MHFVNFGSVFRVSKSRTCEMDALPAGTYLVRWNKELDCHELEAVADFVKHAKIYGNSQQLANRILNTFADRAASTGVALVGEKGSGKSLLAKELARLASEQGIPTLIVSEPFNGVDFNAFIQSIEQPIVVIFDEFEKVYSKIEHQESLLTLLDGVFSSKKLFVLTCNSTHKTSSFLENRPGRIYYRITFGRLGDSVVNEYLADKLADQSRVPEVIRVCSLFESLNFDMLKGLVEEMNRYNESAFESIKYLNMSPEGSHQTYNLTLTVCGKPVELERYYRQQTISPLQVNSFTVEYEEGDQSHDVTFCLKDLVAAKPAEGFYRYANGDFELTMHVYKPATALSTLMAF